MNTKPNNGSFKKGHKPCNTSADLSIEARKRISKKMKGNKNSIGSKSRFGQKKSEEELIKLRSWKRTPEIRLKMSISAGKGEKNCKWIKDRTKLKTDRLKSYDSQYKEWMLKVKVRDGWKCKINNCDCKGRLESHHILSWREHPELRYEINNGITLCQAHHPRKRSEEAELSPYFQQMVAEMK